ncbi:hypothetical protein [Scytonema sp. UIC 10036]|uniref:hypothetical protein n=1 Tax=Scytonema sp. UIC 10036 TaxID=2304196 RepID=UPI00140FA2DA|nr:hypothetical protein [Scytonema sp. UIC 10036]
MLSKYTQLLRLQISWMRLLVWSENHQGDTAVLRNRFAYRAHLPLPQFPITVQLAQLIEKLWRSLRYSIGADRTPSIKTRQLHCCISLFQFHLSNIKSFLAKFCV